MTVDYDPQANAIYVTLQDLPWAYNTVLDEQRVVDYAKGGEPIGVEFLNVSHGVDTQGLPCERAIAEALGEKKFHVYA